MPHLRRVLLTLACLMGGAGVLAASASAHGGGATQWAPAAQILLAHAGAAAALLIAFGGSPGGLAAIALMEAGAALFAADMAMRASFSAALFPSAAPIGGVLVVLGWFLAALIALLRRQP